MKFIRTEKYHIDFRRTRMMGPCSMMLLEELVNGLTIKPFYRVLDLGCGKGLSSLFLAKEFGTTVFAVDSRIDARDNYKFFEKINLDRRVIPLQLDARNEMPFAKDYFDLIVSVDAYHFFGACECFAERNILLHLKSNGILALCIPAAKDTGYELLPLSSGFAHDESKKAEQLRSVEFWHEVFSHIPDAELVSFKQAECYDEACRLWYESDNEFAAADMAAMSGRKAEQMCFLNAVIRKK